MRRAIKIKTFSLIVAWLMIFTHSIIPHNHMDYCSTGCHELIQKTSDENNNVSPTMTFNSMPDNEKVCHVAGFILGQMGQDIPLFHAKKEMTFAVVFVSALKRSSTQIFYIPEHFFSSSSLRAPPPYTA